MKSWNCVSVRKAKENRLIFKHEGDRLQNNYIFEPYYAVSFWMVINTFLVPGISSVKE